jgi:hypothetical protein
MKRLITLSLLIIAALALQMPVHAQDAVSDLLSRINGLRSELGIHPYTLNSALSAAAQNQANWMANTGQVSHTQSDGSTPRTRAAAAGYGSTWVSENIYMGTNATAASAWSWWLNSPIHYRGITSSTNFDIGIASATGANGAAFVLVFGNPGNVAPVSISSSNSSGGSNASAPSLPSFVVGVDNLGNIMHEIQPGDTLGDIALIYGYTWDILPYVREINHMTEEQGRNLEIGAVLLVPPWAGTYTPTPGGPEPTSTPPAILNATSEVIIVTLLPTLTPTSESQRIAPTSDVAPEFLVDTATPTLTPTVPVIPETSLPPNQVAWTAATVTPTPSATPLVVANSNVANNLLEPTTPQVIVVKEGGTSPLLYAAIVLQVCLLGVAGYEFWRRRKN